VEPESGTLADAAHRPVLIWVLKREQKQEKEERKNNSRSEDGRKRKYIGR
jgi:hypothetical protein